ncbi:MAG: hypothetical protein JWM80_4681 [Cyanobacteria bacterium RYN_339]|nr:hypothetical protein [Cyanobacteria bacterium RYN_339]
MARETARYETALAELEEHVGLQAFQGAAGFYAWGRLDALVNRLGRLYDAYELEGDVAPVRHEVDAYLADLAALQLRPDPWVTAHLARFVDDLQAGTAVLTVETRVAAAPQWPTGILAVSPEELKALHASLQGR